MFGIQLLCKIRSLCIDIFWRMNCIMVDFYRVQRPPGLIPSSMIGLESLTGELDEFGFQDFLNDPKESDTIIPVDMHEGTEVRLGLSKGPVSRSFF
ncbi:hypothetical protein M758_9G044100 [Ceratodon purpureus]|nr:hypothetical protein M758_9G044100 [Ceratodon purpureus]